MGVDPISEDYMSISTYQFAHNNPVWKIEIEGLEGQPSNDKKDVINDEPIKYATLTMPEPQVQGGYVGQSLDIVVTAGVKWLCEQFTGSDVSTETAEDIQFYVALAGVVLTKGRNIGADSELLEQGGKQEAKALEKSVPNPNGKNGGKAHQNTIDAQEAQLKQDGFTEVQREVMVKTPEGSKSKRFVDLQGKNPKTGEVKQVQVGKQNKNGTPVSRERKAMDDIEKATGTRPEFVPYN